MIGRRYPIERVRAGVAAMPQQPYGRSADAAARGIMTTDTVPKIASATVGAFPAVVEPRNISGSISRVAITSRDGTPGPGFGTLKAP